MLRLRVALLCLALGSAALGCKKEAPKAPPAPGGGYTYGAVGSSGAGKDDDAGSEPVDAAIDVDAGFLASECVSVDPAPFLNGDSSPDGLTTGVSTPSDFVVTRALASWEADCAQPTILIELSEGSCPDGSAHKLQFLIDADAIDSASPTVLVGLNTLTAEPDDKGIRIRYIRPHSLDPHGTWGTCDGMPGTLELIGDPDTTLGTRLQGRFILDLAACDGTTNEDENVQGSFNVLLRRGRGDVCSTK